MKKLALSLIIIFSLTLPASAILPPKNYKQISENSEIKAIAKVKKVKIIDHDFGINTKRVTFTLIKSFSEKDIPEEFYGWCQSFDPYFWERKHPLVGGTVYHYPKKKQEVFVTVLKNNGRITTYTPLTLKLKAELELNGLKNIEYVIEDIRIKND